jgi:hypothetical protein
MSIVSHTRGDTFERSYILKDAALVPLDLTGATVAFQIRDPDGSLEVDLSTYCTLTPLAGRIDLLAPASVMGLPIGPHRFDLQVTYPASPGGVGRVKTYDSSTLNIVRDATL